MSVPTVLPSDRPRQRLSIAPGVPHALMNCVRCREPWYVIELPWPFTDPAAFVGPCCATFREPA